MLDNQTLTRLKDVVGRDGFCDAPEDIAPHLEEWRSKFRGHSPLLLKPASTAELSALLKICHDTATPVVPQGGNTGLVGGQIPPNGEVLINLSRMNRIRALDPVGAFMVAEAGAILWQVREAASEAGMLFPLSMAAEGSCTIGGNLATNAGGVNVLRYGMARELTLGLEVVLADGTVLDLLRSLRKDNTGYDLKQLFIGAEGTLGIITAATLKLYPKPRRRCTALAAVPNVEAAVSLFGHLRANMGDLPSACELMSRAGLELVFRHLPNAVDPMQDASPWYLLVEATSVAPFDLAPAFEDALGGAFENGLVTDAVIAASETQADALWRLREDMSEAQKREGASLKHDVSVPVQAIPEFLARATAAVVAAVPGIRPVPFGHMGDGNIHFNFCAPAEGDPQAFLARCDEIAGIVHEVVREFSGSFSAEHGIGSLKRADMARYKTLTELNAMRALKAVFDPKNILNPGKVLP